MLLWQLRKFTTCVYTGTCTMYVYICLCTVVHNSTYHHTAYTVYMLRCKHVHVCNVNVHVHNVHKLYSMYTYTCTCTCTCTCM